MSLNENDETHGTDEISVTQGKENDKSTILT